MEAEMSENVWTIWVCKCGRAFGNREIHYDCPESGPPNFQGPIQVSPHHLLIEALEAMERPEYCDMDIQDVAARIRKQIGGDEMRRREDAAFDDARSLLSSDSEGKPAPHSVDEYHDPEIPGP